MTIASYLRHALHTPPRTSARIGLRLLSLSLRRPGARRRAHGESTYTPVRPNDAQALSGRLSPIDKEILRGQCDAVSAAAENALSHRFDLLGSEPVEVAHGLSAAGVEGHRYPPGNRVTADSDGAWLAGRVTPNNLPVSQGLWRRIDAGYRSIDWQLDFKSGFRWSAVTWHGDIRYGELAGVDVKVPWELGRMQHLAHLALAHAATGDGRYPKEFRNQVLDFMAANPPGFGVQWASPMDAAIRVVNWLIAFDLFRAHGFTFDDDFTAVLAAGIRDHGRHVFANLGSDDILRGNHYLCDVVGLLFCGAYLPADAESDAWLTFGLQALIREVAAQFNCDGSNFEASTNYHRLSLEAALFASALVEGLDRRRLSAAATGDPGAASAFPAAYRRRIAAAVGFAAAIVRPDGRACQFGDNDSGRLVKLDAEAAGRDGDHRHLVDAAGGLLAGLNPVGVDGAVIEALRGAAPRWNESVAVPSPAAFPDFGLFVYRADRMWLAVRCGANGQNGFGGHAHNDQLSFELVVDSLPFVVDTGTWLYTPLPAWRHRFRSAAFHNTLAIDGIEQNETPGPGVFRMIDRSRAEVLRRDADAFIGCHYGYGAPHTRRIDVAANGISVVDECAAAGVKKLRLHLHPDVRVESGPAGVRIARNGLSLRVSAAAGAWTQERGWYSPGYGRRRETRVLALDVGGDRAEWSITIQS